MSSSTGLTTIVVLNQKEINGQHVVRLPIPTIYGEVVRLDLLVALAFKPVYLPRHKMQDLEVIRLSDDLSPKNLMWIYGEDGIPCDEYPGFNYVPCYSRYVIDQNGVVISLHSGDVLTPYVGSNGYYNMRLCRDDGQNLIYLIHRMVKSAHGWYPSNADELIINHMDLNKLNPHVTNLEWLTSADNVAHAHVFGAHRSSTGKRAVIVMDITSEEETTFLSIHETARHFGVGTSGVWQAINLGGEPRVFKGRYLMRTQDMPRPENPKTFLDKPQNGRPRPVAVTEVTSGEVVHYDKAIDFVNIMQGRLTRKQIYGRLRKGDPRPVNGYSFQYLDNT